MHLTVKVVPNASKNHIVGFYQGMLKVQLKGIPVKGQLNIELIEVLSQAMDIPKRAICLEHGFTSPVKKISIENAYALKAEMYLAQFKMPPSQDEDEF